MSAITSASASGAEHAEEAFVYRLADPETLKFHERTVERHLLKAVGTPPSDPFFDMSEVSGCFRYFDDGRLWDPNRGGALPSSEHQVVAVCRRFFSTVNRTLSEHRDRIGLRTSSLPDPFPQRLLRPRDTIRIMDPGNHRVDHWLSYWMLELPVRPFHSLFSREQRVAPVYGAVVEVRVGPNNTVESLVSSLRPWTSVIRTPLYTSLNAHGHDHDHEERAGIGELLYVQESIHEPQVFLSPFFDRTSEEPRTDQRHDELDGGGHVHGSMLRPACEYSLLVDISMDFRGRSPVARPLLADEVGAMVPLPRDGYRLRWVYADIDSQIDDEYATSTQNELVLESPGAYHIELTVEDRRTGAVRSTFRELSFSKADIGSPGVA